MQRGDVASRSSSATAAAAFKMVAVRPCQVERREPTDVRTRHSERCPECKKRVREMLEHIYGTCLPNHGFRWQTTSPPTRVPQSRPLCEKWPQGSGRFEDSVPATSYEEKYWHRATSGSRTPDSWSSSTRVSTSRGRDDSRSQRTPASNRWDSARNAGLGRTS